MCAVLQLVSAPSNPRPIADHFFKFGALTACLGFCSCTVIQVTVSLQSRRLDSFVAEPFGIWTSADLNNLSRRHSCSFGTNLNRMRGSILSTTKICKASVFCLSLSVGAIMTFTSDKFSAVLLLFCRCSIYSGTPI